MNLIINSLCKVYGKKNALNDFTYESINNNCIGIIGRNGAGKTTLLKILVGLITSSNGSIEVEFNGLKYNTFNPALAYFIPENPVLLNSFKVYEYFDFITALNANIGIETCFDKREKLLTELEISGEKKIRILNLSKGMKRKVELVAALSSKIPVIIADEICSGLDVPSKNHIVSTIKNSINEGRKFIVSSHDVAFIENVADETILIDHGKCVDVIKKNNQNFNDYYNRISSIFDNNWKTSTGDKD